MSDVPILVLDAPDWADWASRSGLKGPPLLWPVGNQSFIAHWLDHAVRGGFRKVVLHCPDHPAEVRVALEGGAYWSLDLEIRPSAAPDGAGAERLDHLPGSDRASAPPSDAASLLAWWFGLNRDWLRGRDARSVTMDSQKEPGGWIGARTLVAPGTRLVSPYWIGPGTIIGPGCTIGPDALVGPGCVLAANVAMRNSVVLDGSYVGANLELEQKALAGATLIDLKRGVHTTLSDPFIASAMEGRRAPAPLGDRLLALLLLLPALLLHLFSGPVRASSVRTSDGSALQLATGTRGPLLGRRARWLAQVLTGRLHLIGPLPRERAPAATHEELARLVLATPPGVFSLADLHGVHSTDSEEEFPHALYLAAVPESAGEVRSALARLLMKSPPA